MEIKMNESPMFLEKRNFGPMNYTRYTVHDSCSAGVSQIECVTIPSPTMLVEYGSEVTWKSGVASNLHLCGFLGIVL